MGNKTDHCPGGFPVHYWLKRARALSDEIDRSMQLEEYRECAAFLAPNRARRSGAGWDIEPRHRAIFNASASMDAGGAIRHGPHSTRTEAPHRRSCFAAGRHYFWQKAGEKVYNIAQPIRFTERQGKIDKDCNFPGHGAAGYGRSGEGDAGSVFERPWLLRRWKMADRVATFPFPCPRRRTNWHRVSNRSHAPNRKGEQR
jgi:hypothetical protein